MERINNCGELLAYLHYVCVSNNLLCGENIEFQGDVCEVYGGMPDKNGLFIISPQFYLTAFVVGEVDGGHFRLSVLTGRAFILDETVCVDVPKYVYNELIATASGEY